MRRWVWETLGTLVAFGTIAAIARVALTLAFWGIRRVYTGWNRKNA